MKKKKKIIVFSIILLVIIFVLFLVLNHKDSNFIELSSDEVIDKINSKDSFVLCISQTTCSHCIPYKPKLESIANDYNIKIYYTDVDLYSKKEVKNLNKYIYYSGTPTTIFFIKGEEKSTSNRLNGNVNSSKVINKLKNLDFIK